MWRLYSAWVRSYFKQSQTQTLSGADVWQFVSDLGFQIDGGLQKRFSIYISQRQEDRPAVRQAWGVQVTYANARPWLNLRSLSTRMERAFTNIIVWQFYNPRIYEPATSQRKQTKPGNVLYSGIPHIQYGKDNMNITFGLWYSWISTLCVLHSEITHAYLLYVQRPSYHNVTIQLKTDNDNSLPSFLSGQSHLHHNRWEACRTSVCYQSLHHTDVPYTFKFSLDLTFSDLIMFPIIQSVLMGDLRLAGHSLSEGI